MVSLGIEIKCFISVVLFLCNTDIICQWQEEENCASVACWAVLPHTNTHTHAVPPPPPTRLSAGNYSFTVVIESHLRLWLNGVLLTLRLPLKPHNLGTSHVLKEEPPTPQDFYKVEQMEQIAYCSYLINLTEKWTDWQVFQFIFSWCFTRQMPGDTWIL